MKIQIKAVLELLISINIIIYGVCFISCDKESPTSQNKESATVSGTLYLPADANGKTWVVIFDEDRDGDNGFKHMGSGKCSSDTSINYTVDNVPAGTYFVYAVVYIYSQVGEAPGDGDFLGFYGGTLINPPSSPNAVVPSSGTVTFDITLSVYGGPPTPVENSMSFSCTQGNFSAEGVYDPNATTGQGVGWYDSQTIAAYNITSYTNWSIVLLAFQGTIGVGSYSFPSQAYFVWILNFNPQNQSDYDAKMCTLNSGNAIVSLYGATIIDGTFSGSGYYVNNVSQTMSVSGGIFNVSSPGVISSTLPDEIKKVIKRIKNR